MVVSSIDKNRRFPLIIDGFPLYPFLLFRSIRTDQAIYQSIWKLHVHIAFRSFPPRQHSRHNKKQAKQLEALASSPFFLIHEWIGKANRKIRFRLRRAGAAVACAQGRPPLPSRGAKGLLFLKETAVFCFADASNQAFVATCYVFSPIASRLMGRTPDTHVLALCVHNSK